MLTGRSLKILFAADVPPDLNSGAAGTEWQTIQALRRLGHEVDEIWSDNLPHRIRHWNLHYLAELPWGYLDAIRSRVSDKRYDVIHVNQPYAWRVAMEHRRQKWPGIIVNRSHGWEPAVTHALAPWRKHYRVPDWRFPRGLVGRPMRWVLEGLYCHLVVRYSHGIIVSSTYDSDFIQKKYVALSPRVAVIPQAPAAVFVNSDAPPMTVQRARRILHVGQLAFFKGGLVVAELFNRIAEEHPECDLGWCCQVECYAEARSMLNNAARNKVVFHPWMSQEKLVQLYDEYGIFVFPSFYEGFGKAFVEAMARGMCVVASDAGGMRDVINIGGNGFLCPVGDVTCFFDKVSILKENSAQAASLATAATERAREFNWDRVARDMELFYWACTCKMAAGT